MIINSRLICWRRRSSIISRTKKSSRSKYSRL